MYKNILFIEDELLIAEMYASILKGEGFNVRIEPDGAKGLELAQTGNFDLVLLDLMIPSITGLEVMRILRDPQKSPNCSREKVHIIILSNLDEDDLVKKEISEKTEGYFLKVNITPHSLAEILKRKQSTEQAVS
jgi:DNA-binding response OmpR family regulator